MILVILAGILLVILYNLGMADFMDRKIDRVFSPGESAGVDAESMRIWLVSIIGSVMAAWGLSMLYLVNHAFTRREKWAWRSIFYPLLLWYLLDSIISARYGAGFNIVLNTIFFLQLIAPLLFLRNQFFPLVKRVIS